jgi:DNA-binding NtrC family response regulator
MRPATVLVAWDDATLRPGVVRLLQARGLEVTEAWTAARLRLKLDTGEPSVLVLGALAGSGGPLQLAGEIRRQHRHLRIVVLMSESSEELAVGALRLGVVDYFRAPFPLDDVAASVARALEEPEGPAPSAHRAHEAPMLLGTSEAIRAINRYITRVAASQSTVLVTGETGTGKELTAGLIHRLSTRRRRPFVCINCAAIPETLLESELFGFERGAFTGALAARTGKLQQADRGTIFLDEIGDMSVTAQPKILRAIETKEIHPVGARARIPVDVRVIAATNHELDRQVQDGQFRQDLFYRLNVARIHLPPLRERREDLPPLLAHYVGVFNQQLGYHVQGFTPEAAAYLLRYAWPGNVRELRNLVEAVYIGEPSELITVRDLPEAFRRGIEATEKLSEDERTRVLSALFETNWNKSHAAHRLHWSRMTLYRKMAKHHIATSRAQTPGAGRGHDDPQQP